MKPLDNVKEFRRRYELAVEDAMGARPHCTLIPQCEVDEDGRIWATFFCVEHEASWRDLIAVADASVSVSPADISLGTPCGAHAKRKRGDAGDVA